MSPPIIPFPAIRLLHTFGFLGLGQESPAVGMNMLTSMCATLAAIAGPDARSISDTDDRYKIGINWLLTGTMSQELHRQSVFGQLRDYQGTLPSPKPVKQLKFPTDSHAKRKRTGSKNSSDAPPSLFTPELIAKARTRLIADSFLSDAEHDHRSTSLFHDGSNPKLLWDDLRRSHRGHPLVELSVQHARHADMIQNSCLGIMDGNVIPDYPRKLSHRLHASRRIGIYRRLLAQHPLDSAGAMAR